MNEGGVGPPVTGQARRYRSRPGIARVCRIRHEPAEYRLEWGVQCFDGPHVLVYDPKGNYGIELDIFFATYEAIPDRPDHYVKVARVHAWLVTERCVIRTVINGNTEMCADVPAGAYVVENPTGECYALSQQEFEARYELDE